MAKEKLSRSRELAAKVIFAALQILKEKGGQAPGREVIAEVEKRVPLDDWARATYEKSGYVRWQSILHCFSIDCIKAGYLVKKKGVWYLTPEGENALKLGEVGLLRAATAAYRKWKDENQPPEVIEDQDVSGEGQQGQEATIHEIEQLAIEGLKKQMGLKNPYEFQELVAALLRGMGYYTPFVAPQGKDGGIDVIAYRDPLGTVSPRIKVQIKHREASASVQEVRQLMGLLQKDGDVGMFVSSGGFTPDAKTTGEDSGSDPSFLTILECQGVRLEYVKRERGLMGRHSGEAEKQSQISDFRSQLEKGRRIWGEYTSREREARALRHSDTKTISNLRLQISDSRP